jgi:hypothetical protein
MSASKDYHKATVEDLSGTPVLKRFPAFNSSMAGGNMVSEKLDEGIFAGCGSDSEATHDVVAGNVDWVGNVQGVPELPGPDAVGHDHLDTDNKGSGYSPGGTDWTVL